MKKADFRKDPLIFILIAIEVLFLLMLFMRAFRQPYVYSLTGDAFTDNCRGRDYVSTRKGKVVFKGAEYIDGVDLSKDDYSKASAKYSEEVISLKYPLRSGAYQVTAKYKSEGGHYDDAIYDQYITGTLTLKSEEKQSLLHSGVMVFDDAHSEIKGRVYIPFASSISDVQTVLSYLGVGRLEISEIVFEESLSYRFMQMMGFLIFFLLIDIIYLLLFSGHDKARAAADYLKKHREIPVIAAIVILASIPLFAKFLYYGHDLKFHMGRIASLADGIADMRFPVRIETSMLNGYGYATPLFYCDILLYPIALLYLLMVPIRVCYQIYVLAINIFTAVFSYKCFKEMSGDRDIALCATAFYILNIYRLTDIYMRAALGEYTALMFIPLAALGFYRICKKDKPKFGDRMTLAAGMAGVAMSHLLSLELITITLLVYCLIFFRKDLKEKIFSLIRAGVAAVLLSLWFLVPLLISMSSIDAQAFKHITPIQSTGGYFVQLFGLFLSGYGMSGPGTFEGMPVGLGGGFIVIFITALILCGDRFILKSEGRSKTFYKAMAGNFAVGLAAVIFSSVYFPWDVLAGIFRGRIDAIADLMQAIQFPWRYLTVAGIAMSVTLVFSLLILKAKDSVKYMIVFYLTLALIFVSLSYFYYEYTQKNNEEAWIFADNDTKMGIAAEEYLIAEKGREYILSHPYPECIEGDAEISSYITERGRFYLDITQAKEESVIQLPIQDYGNYLAYDTENNVIFSLSQGKSASLNLSLPASYSGVVCIYYKEPLLWRVCELISLITFLGLIFAGIYKRYRSGS